MALIDQFVSDMGLANDAQPVGISTSHLKAHRAVIAMGHLFQGRAAPGDWLNRLLENLRSQYTSNHWTKVRGWLVVNRSPSTNRFANARVAIRNFEMYALKQSIMSWSQIASGNPSGGDYYDDNVVNAYGSANVRANGSVYEFKASTNAGWNNIHIYGPDALGVNGPDIIGLHARCEARLVLDDGGGVDDRSSANLLINLGPDLYPTDGSEVRFGDFKNAGYVPGSGGNRFRFLTNDWTLYTFSTVRPDVDPMPERPVVEMWTYTASAAERSMTESFFRAHPPPTGGVDPQPDTPALLMPASAQAGSVVRARLINAAGSPISGAAVVWQGAAGGVIYGGTTNGEGVVAVRVTTPGSYTLRATGSVTASASITVTTAAVVNRITSSESPGSWGLVGASPASTMTTGQADIYGGTRWGKFKAGGFQSGNPPRVERSVASMLTTGRISAEMFVKRGTHDWIVLLVYGSDSPHASARAWFNVNTGVLGAVETLGAAMNPVATIEPWGGGVFRLALSVETTAGGGSSIAQLRADSANQGFTYPANAEVYVGGWSLHLGASLPHIPTDLDTAVSINSKSLALAQTGQSYADTINCVGMAPITWSISSGSLPAGITANTGQASTTLTLSSASVTATSGSTFTVTATDANGSDSESFTIPVGATGNDPSGLTAAAVNSDTIHLAWIPSAPDATETVVQVRHAVGGGWSDWSEVATVAPSSTQYDVAGLMLGKQHEVRVYQRTPSGPTGYSNVASATTRRLYVDAFASVRALSQTGVDVQVFRAAPPGRALPLGDRIAYLTNQAFGAAAVVVAGIQQAPIRVELSEQTVPPLRNGDRLSAIVTLNSPRRTTQPTSNAVVVEA